MTPSRVNRVNFRNGPRCEIDTQSTKNIKEISRMILDGPSSVIRGIIASAPRAAPTRSKKYSLPISPEYKVKIKTSETPARKKGTISTKKLIRRGTRLVMGENRLRKSI